MSQALPTSQALRLLQHRRYDVAQSIVAAGRRGMGKTYLISNYIEVREPRVLCFDAFDDFRGLKTSDSLENALYDLWGTQPTRRRIRPPTSMDSRDFGQWAFGELFDKLRNCLVVLDEITLWSHFRSAQALEKLVLQGRRVGIRMLIGCQRISLVPDVILSEMTELVLFKMTRPRDLTVCGDWTDDEIAAECRKLDVGRCIVVQL